MSRMMFANRRLDADPEALDSAVSFLSSLTM